VRQSIGIGAQGRAGLALKSDDKQELRKFSFSIFAVAGPACDHSFVFSNLREAAKWLPQETDTILSINADQFERAYLGKASGARTARTVAAINRAALRRRVEPVSGSATQNYSCNYD